MKKYLFIMVIILCLLINISCINNDNISEYVPYNESAEFQYESLNDMTIELNKYINEINVIESKCQLLSSQNHDQPLTYWSKEDIITYKDFIYELGEVVYIYNEMAKEYNNKRRLLTLQNYKMDSDLISKINELPYYYFLYKMEKQRN